MYYRITQDIILQSIEFNASKGLPEFVVMVGGITFRVKPDQIDFNKFLIGMVEPAVKKHVEKLMLAVPSALPSEAPTRRVKMKKEIEEEPELIDMDPWDDGDDENNQGI